MVKLNTLNTLNNGDKPGLKKVNAPQPLAPEPEPEPEIEVKESTEPKEVKVKVKKTNKLDTEIIVIGKSVSVVITKMQSFLVPNTKQVKLLVKLKRLQIVK